MKNHYRAIVGHEFVETDEHIEVKNPYNGNVLTTVSIAGADLYDRAISLAVEVQKKYVKMPACERAQMLQKVSDEIFKRREEIARIITLESGKPIRDARFEVERASVVFRIASCECESEKGEFLSLEKNLLSRGHFAIVRRFPIGAGLGITPFNFPLNLVAHKVAPALASGNAIIIKPSTKTPVSALILADILNGCGIPDGMCSVLPSRSDVAMEVLKNDRRIKFLSFTGSAKVGWHLKSLLVDRKVLLELGGNAAVYIDKDCNYDYALKKSVYGAFAYSGQICISVQRIYVHQDLFEKFLQDFVKETKKLKAGDPLSENVDVGPMIDEENIKRVSDWIDEAIKGGAKILIEKEINGRILKPVVLTGTGADMKVVGEEVFGPVVSIEMVKDVEDAIKNINNSRFGLQAGIFTNNIHTAFDAYENIETGGVVVNDIPTFRSDNMPYGGIKESGFGREGVRYAMEEMSELKTMVLNLNL